MFYFFFFLLRMTFFFTLGGGGLKNITMIENFPNILSINVIVPQTVWTNKEESVKTNCGIMACIYFGQFREYFNETGKRI